MFDDAFKTARQDIGAVILDADGEPIPLILRYRDVRLAAKNWQTFSSDAPFRIPVPSEEDVRSVRQLPIEADPPVHTQFRALVEPFFRRAQHPDYVERIYALISELLAEASRKPSIDVINDFALPLQSRALTYLLNVPESEADIYVHWGTHVFRDVRDGATDVDRYVREQLARAKNDPDATDFFAELTRMNVEGRPLTAEEMQGIANLTFAGGRDTVINAVVNMVYYFAEHPEAFRAIAHDERQINLAAEEFVRVLSPLTFIARVCPHATEIASQDITPDSRVGLCWAAANFDETVFDAPETLRLDRSPNPHVGFGSGHHTCLGAHQARAIMRSLIVALAKETSGVEVLKAVPKFEENNAYRRTVSFEELTARVSSP